MSKKYLVTQDQTVDGMPLEGSAVIHYTTCSTAAATAAKTAVLSGFKLVTGASVIVKFSVTNTAESPTLNVNNTGAKAIRYKNAAIPAGYLAANKVYSFVYDGTYWQLVGDVETNNSVDTKNSIVEIVQGSVGSNTLSMSIPIPTGATGALVEYWTNPQSRFIENAYGSVYYSTLQVTSTGSYIFGAANGYGSIYAIIYSSSVTNGVPSISIETASSNNPLYSTDHYRVIFFK